MSSGDNNRVSTILEADTCQEETANNFSSIDYRGNKSLSPITRLQIKKAQSNMMRKDEMSHALNTRKTSEIADDLQKKNSRTLENS